MKLTIDKSAWRIVGAKSYDEFKALMNHVSSEAFMRAEGLSEAEIQQRLDWWKEVEWEDMGTQEPKTLTSWLGGSK